jgi:hypothetical protein
VPCDDREARHGRRRPGGRLVLARATRGFYGSGDRERPWAKTVSVLRNQYGGHPLYEKGD